MRAITSVLLAVLCALTLAQPGTADGAARATAPVLAKPVAEPTSVTYAGTARPGATVRLQALSALRWTTVRTVTATPRGTFRVEAAYPQTGRYHRVVADRRASRSYYVVRAAAPVLNAPVVGDTAVTFVGRARPWARVRVEFYGANGWTFARNLTAARLGGFRTELARAAVARSYRVLSGGRASLTRRVAAPSVLEAAAPKTTTPTDACGTRPRRADGTYWSCTFQDNFDGTTLDRSKWLVQETSFSAMTSENKDCYVDSPSTLRLKSGTLRLTANRLLAPFTCRSPLGDFESTSTASTITTRDRFTQTYGRFEFRAKMPATAGIPGPHSALWLYPQNHTYGQWPHSGEIDVAEWFSARPENVYPSVHYEGEYWLESTGFNCPMPTASTAFHTYAVEWTPTVMRFFYDGRLCYSHSWTPSGLAAPAPFDHPFYLVLTQYWGGQWNAPDSTTPASATLTVDWARAWK